MNLIELSNDFCLNYLFCLKRASSSLNITQSQSVCIYAIPFTGISQIELSTKLAIDVSTLSRNLDKLINLDLVSKKQSQRDQRSYHVTLTEQGRKVYQQLENYINQELYDVFKSFDVDEKEISDQTSSILSNELNTHSGGESLLSFFIFFLYFGFLNMKKRNESLLHCLPLLSHF